MRCFDDFMRQVECGAERPDATIPVLINIGYAIAGIVAAIVLARIIYNLAIYPIYNVWTSRKRGEADLAQANFDQQIQIARARARKDAASLNKEAAIIEAEAVKAQINTIGESLKTHDLYLRWQWIEMMRDREGETIYVPTEANLPVLEATRRMPE